MNLIWKFNLALIGIFEVGLAATGYISHTVLQANARDEILSNARVMMESAVSSRAYTNTQVKPLLDTQLKYTFLKQSVPAYAATEQFNDLRKKYSDYSYKEAALNPTNPSNRAVDWEADIVRQFREHGDLTELVGERDTPTGRSLYLARPFQIKNGACLVCHSTPEAAPKTMVELYRPSNGFNWKMNEVVAAQIVSVPMGLPIKRANETFRIFMLALGAVTVLTFVLLNIMLYLLVVRPVKRLAHLATEVSMGNFAAGEFKATSRDEIGTLAEALARMKASLAEAMKLLDT